jgi:hypothetical protein
MREFCTAVEAVTDRHGHIPDTASTGMRELAVEARYREQSTWQNPITDTHMFGAMTLRAAADYMRSFAQLFDTEEPPVYGHVVVARAAFESASVSSWLNDAHIGVPERIRRGLCEQLYSAREVHDLGITPDSLDRVDEWVAVATSFGWTAKRSSSKIAGSGRPSVSEGIVRAADSGEQSRIGDLLYCRTAAVSHVTWFGLQTGLDIAGAEVDPVRRSGKVAIGTDTARVGPLCFYMSRAVRAAASSRVELMGWTDTEWRSAVDEHAALELDLARRSIGQLPRETHAEAKS